MYSTRRDDKAPCGSDLSHSKQLVLFLVGLCSSLRPLGKPSRALPDEMQSSAETTLVKRGCLGRDQRGEAPLVSLFLIYFHFYFHFFQLLSLRELLERTSCA